MSLENQLNIPLHIGFIMDGNRRWGKKHLLKSPIKGTKQGRDTLYDLVEAAVKMGVKHITAFAFSAENWRRTPEEVSYLLELLKKSMPEMVKRAKESNLKLKFVGRLTDFNKEIQGLFKEAEKETAEGDRAILNVAVSYGGRAEIIDAVKRIIEAGTKPEEISEEKFNEYIYEAGQPNLDLIIRTGGVNRTSGFMLWQSDYSEMYFTKTLWPDFKESELKKAFKFYSDTKRNFGK